MAPVFCVELLAKSIINYDAAVAGASGILMWHCTVGDNVWSTGHHNVPFIHPSKSDSPQFWFIRPLLLNHHILFKVHQRWHSPTVICIAISNDIILQYNLVKMLHVADSWPQPPHSTPQSGHSVIILWWLSGVKVLTTFCDIFEICREGTYYRHLLIESVTWTLQNLLI